MRLLPVLPLLMISIMFHRIGFSTVVTLPVASCLFPASGRTLAVGKRGAYQGGIGIFYREATSWYLFDGTATDSDERYFGEELVLSPDGRRLLVGDPTSNDSGRALVYELSPQGGWVPLSEPIIPNTNVRNSVIPGQAIFFGSVLDISHDGSIVAIGAQNVQKHFVVLIRWNFVGFLWESSIVRCRRMQ